MLSLVNSCVTVDVSSVDDADQVVPAMDDFGDDASGGEMAHSK